MTPSTLIFAIRAVNVPSTLQHKARKLEIEELPDYLQVEGRTPGQLYLINFGNASPGADASGYPWLKTASDGMPDGLYVKYNGVWYPAELHGVTAPQMSFPMILAGTATYTTSNPAAWTDNGKITFSTPFASTPRIMVTPTALDAAMYGANALAWKAVVTADLTGFNIWTYCASTAKSFTVDWTAIGVRNPAA